MTQENWNTMKIKMIFLYKILNHMQVASEQQVDYMGDDRVPLPLFFVVRDLVATLGCNLIILNRKHESIILGREESKNVQNLSQVIADGMMNISMLIAKQRNHKLTESQFNLLIESGIDVIIGDLKKVMD